MLEKKDVCLVSLPMSDIITPSLALSLFAADLRNHNISTVVDYANIFFAKQLGVSVYRRILMTKYLAMMGEFIFRLAAHGEEGDIDGFISWMTEQQEDCFGSYKMQNGVVTYCSGDEAVMREQIIKLQHEAESFIEETAERILSYQCKIVAISSMFQQINSTIALAKRLKEKSPEIVILVGGANCFDTAGGALMGYCPQIDYVFLGEADETFVPFCEKILGGEYPSGDELPFGIADKNGRCKRDHRLTFGLEKLVYPDFDDYFTAIDMLPEKDEIPRKIILEGSRGCWWGEKHSCTFCGLNSGAARYREKSAEYFAEEIKYCLSKYPDVAEVVLSDCILSNEHTKKLPELLKDLPYPVKFFCEIKSNVTLADLSRLKSVGFFYYQPGIESLNDHVLTLMNKGCRAIKQVEALKNYCRLNLFLVWNLLCGFPGETIGDYEDLLGLFPKITHLKPPSGLIHIAYHRSSEYERNRDKYGLNIKAARFYDYILPPEVGLAEEIAYIFEPVADEERRIYYDACQIGAIYKKLWQFVAYWNRQNKFGYVDRLDMTIKNDMVEICDLRRSAKKLFYELKGLRAKIYMLTEQVINKKKLKELLPEEDEVNIEKEINYLCDENLLLSIGDELLALAVKKED